MNELESLESTETPAEAEGLSANELEYINGIEGLQPEKWESLSPEKRQGVLQELENKMAEIQGRTPRTVLAGNPKKVELVEDAGSCFVLVNTKKLSDVSSRQKFIDAFVGTSPGYGSRGASSTDGMYMPGLPMEWMETGEVPKPPFKVRELPPTERNGEIREVDLRTRMAREHAGKLLHSDLPEVPEDRMVFGDVRHTHKEYDIEPYAESGDGTPVYRCLPYFSQVKGEFIAPVHMGKSGWQYLKFPAEGAERTAFVKSLNEQTLQELKSDIASSDMAHEMELNRLRAMHADNEAEMSKLEYEAKGKAIQREMGEHERAWAQNMTRDQMIAARDAGLTRVPRWSGDDRSDLFKDGSGDLHRVDASGDVRKL